MCAVGHGLRDGVCGAGLRELEYKTLLQGHLPGRGLCKAYIDCRSNKNIQVVKHGTVVCFCPCASQRAVPRFLERLLILGGLEPSFRTTVTHGRIPLQNVQVHIVPPK